MRRLGRWLLNGVTGVSLAVCAAGIVLFVMGAGGAKQFGTGYCWHEGTFEERWSHSGRAGPGGFAERGWNVAIGDDRVQFWFKRLTFRAGVEGAYFYDAGWQEPQLISPLPKAWLVFGCDGYNHCDITRSHMEGMATVPLSFVTVVAGLLPSLRLYRRHRRRLQHRPGLCSVCGYDLRATPERCPECGAVPGPQKR